MSRKSSKDSLKYENLYTDEFYEELNIDFHKMPVAEVCRQLQTNLITGLTYSRVRENLDSDGHNILTRPTRNTSHKFFKCLFSGFGPILWVAVIFCWMAFSLQPDAATDDGEDIDEDVEGKMDFLDLGTVLIFVIIFNGFCVCYLENTRSNVIKSFRRILPLFAEVIRDGEQMTIHAENVTRGDLVDLKMGDSIPADILIIEQYEFKVNNFVLTGDDEPQSRGPEYTSENPLETRNLVFCGTTVVEGSAKGIVIAIGHKTVLGRIEELAVAMKTLKSPICREISWLVHVITLSTLIFIVCFGLYSYFTDYLELETYVIMIGVILANVPEGLLAILTASMYMCAKRMSAKNCWVCSLEAIETLGLVSVICTNKHGTLKVDRMTVTHIYLNGEVYETDTYKDRFGEQLDRTGPEHRALARSVILNSRAYFRRGQADIPVMEKKVSGDATDAALLKWVETKAGNVRKLRRHNIMVAEIPYDPQNGWEVSVHEMSYPPEISHLVVIKALPAQIIQFCTTILIDGQNVPFDLDRINDFSKVCATLTDNAEYLFGFCDLALPVREYPFGYRFNTQLINFPMSNMRFVGMVAMADPAQPAVPHAIRACRSAGIKVIMVTEEHPVTAAAIARNVSIISEDSETVESISKRLDVSVTEVDPLDAQAIVVHGSDLCQMEPEELCDTLLYYDEIVFAGISAKQKLLIVESCQRLGETVALTGDAVQDAPALKRADVGIAMGMNGTDVAQQAADIVLLDDSFATILAAMEESRTTFDNIRKSTAYVLTSNMPEVMAYLIFILLDIPLPLGILAILCIDLVTDMLPAITLAFEPPEYNVANTEPLSPFERQLATGKMFSMAYAQIGVIQAAAGFFSYFVVMARNGFFAADLIGIGDEWNSPTNDDLLDSLGQEWTFEERKVLACTSQTAFFVAIVSTQWANLIICKTRKKSIVDQRMCNCWLNFALIFETIVAVYLTNDPNMYEALDMQPLSVFYWFPAIPFAIFIIVYDELRRYYLRRKPNSWLEKETYY